MAQTKRLDELIPDRKNANKGTPYGLKLLDDSLRKYGAGRSILVDKHGRIIAGNKTTERAADLGFENVIIVETDGTQLVTVQRTDLDLEDDKGSARALALYDNRVSEVDLEWDLDILETMPKDLLTDLRLTFDDIDYDEEWQGMPEFENEPKAAKSIIVHFRILADYESFCALIEQELTDKTNNIWFPQAERRNMKIIEYQDES